ncbi:MAG: hypothetical protein NTW03_14860, partial [Verrucomicrobia bacterium]|nr:hypothetical protein [Verrucomicrobiota bacterium]
MIETLKTVSQTAQSGDIVLSGPGFSPGLNAAQKIIVGGLAGSMIIANTVGSMGLFNAPEARGGLGGDDAVREIRDAMRAGGSG